jgi:hypothetical protein
MLYEAPAGQRGGASGGDPTDSPGRNPMNGSGVEEMSAPGGKVENEANDPK